MSMLAETVSGPATVAGLVEAPQPSQSVGVCATMRVCHHLLSTPARLSAPLDEAMGAQGGSSQGLSNPRERWQSMISGARESGLQPIDADSPEVDAAPCMRAYVRLP